ncbi:odorant receptor Or2-like [Nomia melanderi]|uniref:odorant receptor Or2-like n=1 Tax=Nomia melanderi TaxID=2448451 RepID=UPI003FCD3E16
MKKEKKLKVEADDYAAEDDLSIRWTAMLLKFVGMWLAKDPAEQRRRDITFAYSLFQLFFAIWVQTRDFYFSWPDFEHCTYVACNLLSIILVTTKLLLVYFYREDFIKLVIYTRDKVWFSKYNPVEQVVIIQCKKLCIATTLMIVICLNGTLSGYVLTSFLENEGRNHSDRILLFNMWIDLPLSDSPQYEILYVIQVLSLYHVGICFICFDNFLCIVNLYITAQFRILRHRLMNLGGVDTEVETKSNIEWYQYTGRCYLEFKDCVRKHQENIDYCNKVNRIFTIISLVHVLVFNVLLGLVCYEVFLAQIVLMRRLLFTFNIIGSLIQLFGFTYSCGSIMNESSKIGTAAYSGPWTRLPMNLVGKMIRKDLNMMILRSEQPCSINAGRFFPICLETFTAVVSTAMSYLTLLRQSMIN